MSRMVILILMYYSHKPGDLVNIKRGTVNNCIKVVNFYYEFVNSLFRDILRIILYFRYTLYEPFFCRPVHDYYTLNLQMVISC
jgi:hypothetical protein